MLPLPHVVVSTQLDFSVKNESFDDLKIADYLFFFNMQDFTLSCTWLRFYQIDSDISCLLSLVSLTRFMLLIHIVFVFSNNSKSSMS